MERLAINPRKVVHETIDGEVIAIHLESGCYYSLDGTAAEVWATVGASGTRSQIVAAVQARYPAEGTIQSNVDRLLEELLGEDLIERNGAASAPAEMPPPVAAAAGPPPGTQFTPPVLRKYTDMQDMLRLDPIHDADDSGWPGRGR
jgi:hypothetical protein